jgi:hypothetical protein
MIVYAKPPYAYVYADNNAVHKQGKVSPDQPMTVIKANAEWLQIEPLIWPVEIDKDTPIDYENYGDFWVRTADVTQAPPAPPAPPEQPPEEKENWLIRFIRWLLKLLGIE